MSELGLNLGYTVKYYPLPSGVPLSRPNTDTVYFVIKQHCLGMNEFTKPFLGIFLNIYKYIYEREKSDQSPLFWSPVLPDRQNGENHEPSGSMKMMCSILGTYTNLSI